MTAPFKNLKNILDPQFASDFVGRIKDKILSKLTQFSEAELREINKDAVSEIINELKGFLTLALNKEEVYKICETTQLMLAIKFIKSPYMKKRLQGVNEINDIIETLTPKRSNTWGMEYDSPRDHPKFIDQDYLIDWIKC